jgi:hypothetical protein
LVRFVSAPATRYLFSFRAVIARRRQRPDSGRAIQLAAVATVGRTLLSFVIALLLAVPTAAYHWLSVTTGEPHWSVMSWCFAAALYGATLVYLLHYVFQRDVMTGDRLFGAAAWRS